VRLEHSFEVPVPVERAWEVLLDIERVAPCMPGATLTSHDGDNFTGTVKVKLGPVNLTYRGKGRFVDIDAAAHRVVITASGADTRGAGTAAADVSATMVAVDSGTSVEVVTDLNITGKAVQFGRGMIGDVSARLIGQFADCLAGKFAGEEERPEAGSAEPTAAGSAVVAQPPESQARPAESEAIDLLAVSGVGPAARRAAPYVAAALASLLVVLGVIWWVRR
jgi:carbon monoxide dehydrogenase subunit G